MAYTYVVQVETRRERRAQILIQNMVPQGLVDEVFYPTYVKQIKRQGTWHETKALLVPGYVYLNTSDINQVVQHLRDIPALTKVLGTRFRFVPLTDEEMMWLGQLTEPGKRTVAMSKGIIEGDEVRIISGPLRGHEARIAKIDRHKRSAQIEFQIMGRKTLIRVGLEIVKKTS